MASSMARQVKLGLINKIVLILPTNYYKKCCARLRKY